MAAQHEPQLRNVQQVLADGVYSIPVYQRNYAWGATEIKQLIEDVRDYAQRNAPQEAVDFYVGTLVVYRRRTDEQQHWEVVDGQQRLTTLTLLASVLGAMRTEPQPLIPRMPLQFECREASSQALQAVFANPLEPGEVAVAARRNAASNTAEDASGASSIWEGRAIIEDVLQEMREDERLAFSQFLLNQVQLLRVELPQRTDLNHYFECMNNRGEQLAKHEVLKAQLLGTLQHSGNHAAMQMLHSVWDACSVMDRSVQSGFSPALRQKLFSVDGRTLAIKDLGALLRCFDARDERATYMSLTQLVLAGQPNAVKSTMRKTATAENDDDEGSAQFGAVINFPNFLLQVLAMMPGKDFIDTPLDDKQLLTAFEPLRGDAALVQDFAIRLLRCRFLLDQYVIKSSLDSEDDEEHWQLQRCKFKNDKAALHWVSSFDDGAQDLPERLRMLQAALHVSYMLPSRKHWLQGTLRWLCRQEIGQAIDVRAYLQALEGLAKAFVLEVGAHADTPVGYEEVVHRGEQFFEPQHQGSDLVQALPHKLVYGRARLIDFNFLDYLLWLQAKDQGMTSPQEWRDFAFTSSRRSVEHLHPQTELFKGNAWDDDHLHAFGNLCLVSHAMNSRLRNSGPEDKFKQLMSERSTLSMKIFSMHRCFNRDKSWSADQSMASHASQVLGLLSQAFATRDLLGFVMNSMPVKAEGAIA